MPLNYYPKLALDSIKKNKQFYLPYIITCILFISIYYILSSLKFNEQLLLLPGFQTIQIILDFGTWIIVIFSILFFFYTNSFLIRRRKKEFGLYSILGLSKSNISVILFFEYLYISLISLSFGLVIGILFSKFFELGLLNLIHTSINFNFSISFVSVVNTIVLFGSIYILLYLNVFFQIRFLNISQLLISESVGEKPPSGNWILALIGFISLGFGYWLSISLEDPLSALVYFFIAVIFVIIGVYLLFISGSVLICRLLQKNKKFYYKLNHFISVSSMAYRMKRNGAGLASICILSTMVLVTLCSTICLYLGSEKALNNRYPKDLNINISIANINYLNNENITNINEFINNIIINNGAVEIDPLKYKAISSIIEFNNNHIDNTNINFNDATIEDAKGLTYLYIIDLADYNHIMNSNLNLNSNEVYVYNNREKLNLEELNFNDNTIKVKGVLDKMFTINGADNYIFPHLVIICDNILNFSQLVFPDIEEMNSNNFISFDYYNNFNLSGKDINQSQLNKIINEELDNPEIRNKTGIIYSFSEGREENKQDFYSLYGGLFYLGFILSIIFIFTTVLIIYYKQIVEGFEDQKRFKIMQSVGLTQKQVKQTINSQLLIVFFIPLIMAIINMGFAFPALQKLLIAFGLTNTSFLIKVTLIGILGFSVLYIIVFKITSNQYYKIVT